MIQQTQAVEGFPTSQTEYTEWAKKYNPPKKVGDPWTQNISADTLTTPTSELAFPADTTAPNGTTANNSALGTNDMMSATLKRYQDELANRQEQQQTWIQKLAGQKSKSKADLLAEQQQQYGVTDMVSQIQGITNLTLPLQQQLADLSNRQQREIDRNDSRLASTIAKDREANVITLKYAKMQAPIATQLNAYAAQAQVIQGNMTAANQFITQAVNAAVYDQEYEYNRTRDMIDLNKDFINGLKSDEKWLFTNMLNMKQNELDDAKTEKTAIGNLMLNYPKAGIIMNDSYSDAVAKATAWSGSQVTADETTGWVTGTPTSYKEWQLAGSPGEYQDWVQSGKTIKSPTSGASFSTRLNQEVNNIYRGVYGVSRAREKAIDVLKNEFPNVPVSQISNYGIYNRVPNEWEKNVTGGAVLKAQDATRLKELESIGLDNMTDAELLEYAQLTF